MLNSTQNDKGVSDSIPHFSDFVLISSNKSPAQDVLNPQSIKVMSESSGGPSVEALCKVAADMLNYGKAKMAADYCLLAIRQRPDAKAYKLLGDSLQQLQSWPEAEQAYYQSLQQDPKQAETYANLGSLYAQQQQWAKALGCYQKTLNLKPGLSVIEQNIGQIWQHIRHSDNAIEQLYKQLVSEPKQFSVQDHLRLGEILLERHREMQAVVCYRQALLLEPNLAEARQRLEEIVRQIKPGSQTISAGQSAPMPLDVPPQISRISSQAVETTLRPAVPSDSAPVSPMGSVKSFTVAQIEKLLSQGTQHMQQQQWQQALDCYEQAVALHPNHAAAQWQLATVLDRFGQKDRAIEHYFQSLSLDTTQVSAADLCRFGDILKQHNQLDRAVNCYQWALTKANKAQIHRQLAEVFSKQEKYQESSTCYQKAVELEPNWQNYHDLGDALLKLQQWESAAQAYTQAIQLNSEFSWSHNNLGDALLQLKQLDLAAQAYQRAILLNPDFHWSHYNLGEVCKQQEKWEQAVAAYRKVLQIQPNCSVAEQRLHEVLHQRAKADLETVQSYYQRAIEQDPHNPDYFHQAIALQPGNAELYLGLAKALIHQRQPDEAKLFYQMALQVDPEIKKKSPRFEQFLRIVGHGVLEGRRALPVAADRPAMARLIHESKLFDTEYYLRNYPLVASSGMSPIEHYIERGAWQGYNPNPFFHSAYYLAKNSELVNQRINPLLHYICCGAASGCDPNPFFDTLFYLGLSPDVAQSSLNPLAHYLHYGLAEGRVAFPIDRVLTALQQKESQAAPRYLKLLEQPSQPASRNNLKKLKIGVYCNSLGNYFMAEIADFVAAALQRVGVAVVRLSEMDHRPPDLDDDIVVAPHEFFYLGEGNTWLNHPKVARSVMVNVEQPHTSWFARAFYSLQKARVVLDINVKSAAILDQLGLPAYFLPLGYLPNYDAFNATGSLPDLLALKSLPSSIRHNLPDLDAPLISRPIDVHFIGTLTDRREQFLGSQAAKFSQFKCFFHIPPVSGPLLQGQDQALTTEAVIGLSRRSKILLNIHREELPYFEWHRIIFHGLWQKTLVVTEPCHPVPELIPGEHYIECELDRMADQIAWLLNTSEGQAKAERVRQAGYERLKQQFNFSQTIQHTLELLSRVNKVGGRV